MIRISAQIERESGTMRACTLENIIHDVNFCSVKCVENLNRHFFKLSHLEKQQNYHVNHERIILPWLPFDYIVCGIRPI